VPAAEGAGPNLAGCLELASDRAVERAGTTAAQGKEQRARADEQRIFPTALAPEEAFAEVNFTATIMKMRTAAAAKRVSSPSTNRIPPISSVQPTNVPQNTPGVNPRRSNNAALPAKPMPPNAPNSFCMPCGMRIAPSVMRKIGSAYFSTAL